MQMPAFDSTLSVTLDHDADSDLDLVVTGSPFTNNCVLDECVGFSETAENPDTFAAGAPANQTVTVWVESASVYDGGAYTLSVECAALEVEDCTNGSDDDGDGLQDCADADCASDPLCLPAETCGNGIDDDGDGAIDCGDSDCDFQCVP